MPPQLTRRAAATLAFALSLSAVRGLTAAPLPPEEHSTQCATCHGIDGNSQTEGVPSLAGQPAKFIESQLRRFRDGQRRSPTMQRVAQSLTADQSSALARYYADLPVQPRAEAADAALLAKGQAIAVNRVCGSCHRSGFQGRGAVPRLAGQREDYLRSALLAYREQLRGSAEQRVMIAAAQQMPDEHIRALAHFLASCR